MAHIYLAWSLVHLAICTGSLIVFREHRQLMLRSALFSVPTALYAIAFVPEYWRPETVAGSVTSPEDVLFSFANGGIVWLLAFGLSGQRVTARRVPHQWLFRYLGCTTLFVATSLPLWLAGLKVMSAGLIGSLVVLGFVGWRCRALWRAAIGGGLGFMVLYAALLGGVLAVWPHLLLQWNIPNLWGLYLLNIPLEEIVWALAYGAVWPLLMAYVFDARPIAQDVNSRDSHPGSGFVVD